MIKASNNRDVMNISNKRTYESNEIVEKYSLLDQLKKPEQTILDDIKAELSHMKMLDIGVGGGRTTIHFANLVNEYIGVDYSESMVNVCKKRFSKLISDKIYFKSCDARYMKIFENNYFDFILFSWCGIDSMCHEDRIRVLEEISRIGKKDGLFCFSTHNIQHIDELCKIQFSENPIRISWRVIRHLLIRLMNKDFEKLKDKKYAAIRDGYEMFGLINYYIKPREQLKQLRDLGFENIKIYSYDGNEIEDLSKLDTSTDLYLYYLCNIQSPEKV